MQRPRQAGLCVVVVTLFHLGHGEVGKRQRVFLVQFEDVQKLLFRLAEVGLHERGLAGLEFGCGPLRQGGDLGLERVGWLALRLWLGEQFLFLVGVRDLFGLEHLESRPKGVYPVLQLRHLGLFGPTFFSPVEDAGEPLPLAGRVGVSAFGLGQALLEGVDVVAHFLFFGTFLEGLELGGERVVAVFGDRQAARGFLEFTLALGQFLLE